LSNFAANLCASALGFGPVVGRADVSRSGGLLLLFDCKCQKSVSISTEPRPHLNTLAAPPGPQMHRLITETELPKKLGT
jgi:hypothetical protein